MKKFFILITVMANLLAGFSQDLYINEVSFKNRFILRDFDNDSPDWIEIYNSSQHPIDLKNFGLIDDTAKIAYWHFPSIQIGAGEFLIVFASGKDTLVDGELHTSFKLSDYDETVYLLDPRNDIVDYVNPSCVPEDHSISRIPDGSSNLVAAGATPGNSNNFAEIITVSFQPDTLIVNHESGFYQQPFAVNLSNSHPGNIIVYTLNGDEPDHRSAVFHEPLIMNDLTPNENRFANIPETIIEPGNQIFKANILRAVVMSNGCPASNEIICTYFVNESITGRYDIPIVSLITDEENLFDDENGLYVHGKYRNFDQHGGKWERDVHVEILDAEGNLIINQDAGMRIHGRGSRRSPQKSLRLYADADYGKEYFEYPLFSQKPELERFRVLLLRTTGGTLGPVFKEELCNLLVQNLNIDYPATETAILFINGEYWGIYNLMERQNKYYVEGKYNLPDTEVDIIAYDRQLMVEEGSIEEYNNLINWINNADPASEGFFSEAERRIDLASIIDYYSSQFYFGNFDWPASNIELWKIKNDTARWRFFFFDSDASMVWVNHDRITEHTHDLEKFRLNENFCTVILETLLKNKEFRSRFLAAFYHHMNFTFRADKVIDAINLFEKKYSPLMPEHIYRWHNPVDYPKWEENVSWLRSFAIQRPLYIAEQLERNFGEPLIIYPNPSNGNFMLKSVAPAEYMKVKIYSTEGRVLRMFTFEHPEGNEAQVNTGLLPGAYLIQVSTGTNILSAKLFVQ